MTTETMRPRAVPALVVVALTAALLMLAPLAQSSSADGNAGGLVGEWRMTSLEVGTGGELAPVPYSGMIIFTKSGTMSVQAMNPDTSAPDGPYTVNGYESFYGKYDVDRRAGTFDVTVESSAVRGLIWQRLTRVFEVSRNRLVLTPADPAEGWRVTYERA